MNHAAGVIPALHLPISVDTYLPPCFVRGQVLMEIIMTHGKSVVVPVDAESVLDAAAAYLKQQYGASHGLDHPTDRERILSSIPSAPAPSSLAGGWRSPTEVPEAKKGEHAYRIVAVKRADGEKVVTFSALYMNAVPLWFEDDNESRNVTGWHSDDGPTYSPLLTEGDALMGWREFPQWEAALSPEAPARETEEGVEDTPWPESPLATALFRHVQSQFSLYDDEASEEAGEIVAILVKHSVDPTKLPALTPRHEAPACKNKGGDVDQLSAGCLVSGCTSEMGETCKGPANA